MREKKFFVFFIFKICAFFVGCYPYVKNDPFIINDTPHVFFAGNQPKFETHLYQGNAIEIFFKIFYFFI
jgi:hypothetical protein